MTDKINNFRDLEMAADQFQEAITFAYNENCPLTVSKNNRNTTWWNQGLAEKRRKVRKLFNVAKKSGDWTDYKKLLQSIIRHSDRPRGNHGGDTVRRLRRLQNVPGSIGYSLRMSRVLLAPFNLKMEIMNNRERNP